MAKNPDPSRITDALWWLWEQLHELEPGSQLGGIYANTHGYHNTRDYLRRNEPRNYSIADAVDQGGPGDKGAALDWTFPDAQRGDYKTINRYCQRLDKSSRDVRDPRLNGLREWYGQTDSDRQVEGWDCRYLRPVSSDSSHLWHIHFSITRSLVNDMRTMSNLLSVLRGESVEQWRSGSASPAEQEDEDENMQILDFKEGYERGCELVVPGGFTGFLNIKVDSIKLDKLGEATETLLRGVINGGRWDYDWLPLFGGQMEKVFTNVAPAEYFEVPVLEHNGGRPPRAVFIKRIHRDKEPAATPYMPVAVSFDGRRI